MTFDVLAPHYGWMELALAGEKLQRCRTAFLDEVPSARNILLAGEGHGRCLVECCRRFNNARILCVDASGGMLARARGRLAAAGGAAARVEFICADILHWPAPARAFDLIATNFFLDCFRPEQLGQLIARLARAAAPGANWLVADFQISPAGLKRARSRLIVATMYVFFRAVTRLPARRLTAPDPWLQRAGFVLHRRREAEWGLLRSDWWRRPAGWDGTSGGSDRLKECKDAGSGPVRPEKERYGKRNR